MFRRTFMWCMISVMVVIMGVEATAQSKPEGQLTIVFDTSIASTFLDPAETSGIATPFVFLYALHDSLSKPLPGNNMAPCLAESWTESADGLVYEFTLRHPSADPQPATLATRAARCGLAMHRYVSLLLLNQSVSRIL